jgi:hypothetical protein
VCYYLLTRASARAKIDLRAQLAAVISPSHNAPHGYGDVPGASSSSPHDQNIDPAIGGPGGMMSAGADQGGDEGLDGRKAGKRELSNSKRAAQNRAAQVRGFSQSGLLSFVLARALEGPRG